MKVDFDECVDLDWFAVDRNQHLAHFATGGKGAVPLELLSNRPHLQAALAIIRSLPQRCEALVNPELTSHVVLTDASAEARYLRSFVEMAQRGLYSFDCHLGTDAPAPYFLVAKPEIPLTLDGLGESERQSIGLIRLHISLFDETSLDVANLSS